MMYLGLVTIMIKGVDRGRWAMARRLVGDGESGGEAVARRAVGGVEVGNRG